MNPYRLLAGFLPILFPLSVSGQVDSLLALPADSLRAKAILTYLQTSPDLGPDRLLLLAREAYDGARRQQHHILMGRLSDEEAFIHYGQGELTQALELLGQGGLHYLRAGDSLRWARNLINQGLLQTDLGADDQAVRCYQAAAAYLDRAGQPSSRLYNNLAIIYRKQEKYEQAISLYERSLALKAAEGDSAGLAATHLNLGLLFSHQGELDLAISQQQQALAIYAALDQSDGILEAQTALGGIYLNAGRFAEAGAAYAAAMAVVQPQSPPAEVQRIHYGLGRVALEQARWETAVRHLETALALARDQARKEDIQIILRHLAEARQGQGKMSEAFAALAEALARKDTLAEASRQALTEEMQARFEVQQAEERERQQALQFAQRERLGAFILALSATLLLGALAFMWLMSRKNRLLRQQRAQVEQALAEKEAIMQEMHHRIKNNLQFLSSLLSLQAREPAAAAAREVLLTSRSRVLSMALVHQHLYEEAGRTAIRMDAYLRKLTAEVLDSLHAPHQEIALKLELAPLLLDVDQAVPVALITHEALVNALKYAFPGQGAGELRVSLQARHGQASLLIADNGQGPQDTREGFGQRLMQLLAERLRGTLRITHQPGLQIQLEFPFLAPPYAPSA
ncbi:MAG: tetratricopeptide repeat protein [Bacteroidetes bacterium]|nr:MAG: tetratricopeptide repeat protein [Bacteroidota bacterium]